MNAVTRTATMVLALLVSVGTASEAMGQTRLRPAHRLVPHVVTNAPTLGYRYQVIPGYGFRVLGVMRGTPAAWIGLEPGDVILTINGHRLTHFGADVPVRMQAAANGGWVTLRVRDVRTGRIAFRTTNLFSPHHPIGRPIVGQPNTGIIGISIHR